MPAREQHTAALDRVLEVAVLVDEDMTRSLARDGLTPARTHLLWEVHHRGPSTQQVLAGALGVTPRNVTGLVDGLVETGFVTRGSHPTDRRATLVATTRKGARIVARMVRQREEFADLLFADLSDRQLAALVVGLDAVLMRLRDAVPRPPRARR